VTPFIDAHVHPPLERFLNGAFAPFRAGLERFFNREIPVLTATELADRYRSRGGRAVLLAWDAETATGHRAFGNDTLAEVVNEHPDVFLGFGSVDPHRGAAAVAGVHEARRLGLQGLMFHPPAQRFSPADRRHYPVWEVAQQERLPVLIHTGFTALGAGTRGGGGIDLASGDPMLVDRVATDFPGLDLVIAHPSALWVEQAVAVARHKENVYLELSGWVPGRMPSVLAEAIAGPLADRVLFGSDFPFGPEPDPLAAWERSDLEPDLLERLLIGNARRLLGLDQG
jgi:predicted TIM-barrel fold metal-dependent hydrolase